MSTDSFRNIEEPLKRGDAEAASAIFRRFSQRLAALARKQLADDIRHLVDPDDVVQSVFLTFFRRHAESPFDIPSWDALWALLARIAVRKAQRQTVRHRAARRDVRRVLRGADSAEQPVETRALDREPVAAEVAAYTEMLEVLLDRLPPQKRGWLLLRLSGCTVAEISALVGRTERSIYRLMGEARRIAEELEVHDTNTP